MPSYFVPYEQILSWTKTVLLKISDEDDEMVIPNFRDSNRNQMNILAANTVSNDEWTI